MNAHKYHLFTCTVARVNVHDVHTRTHTHTHTYIHKPTNLEARLALGSEEIINKEEGRGGRGGDGKRS